MRFLIILLVLSTSVFLSSCDRISNSPTGNINEQGIFMSLGSSSESDYAALLPANVDPETVLCFGKGFKVGRCINKEMEKGICMGLLMHNGSVVAVEIPCETITKDSLSNPVIVQ